VQLSGSDEQELLQTARELEKRSAKLIAVHGMVQQQSKVGYISVEAIRKVVRAVSVPGIANGSVVDEETAQSLQGGSRAAGVMVGQGFLINPLASSQHPAKSLLTAYASAIVTVAEHSLRHRTATEEAAQTKGILFQQEGDPRGLARKVAHTGTVDRANGGRTGGRSDAPRVTNGERGPTNGVTFGLNSLRSKVQAGLDKVFQDATESADDHLHQRSNARGGDTKADHREDHHRDDREEV
jgi:hypothetical protein